MVQRPCRKRAEARSKCPCGIMILKTSVYSLPVHGVSKPLGLKGRPGGTLPRGPGEKPEPVVSQKGVGFLVPVSLICLS